MAQVDMDMDYDPEEDDGESAEARAGTQSVWAGWFGMAALFSWDLFGSTPPHRLTYAIVALWLVLAYSLRMVGVVYQ